MLVSGQRSPGCLDLGGQRHRGASHRGASRREWASSPIPQPGGREHDKDMTTQRPIHATSRQPDQPAGANGGARTAPAKAAMTAGGLKAARGELARLRRRSGWRRLEQRRAPRRAGGPDGARGPDCWTRPGYRPRHGCRSGGRGTRRRGHRIDGLDRRRRYWSRNPVPVGQRTLARTRRDLRRFPMGHALIGAAPGATLTIRLPNGRPRRVRLVDVTGIESNT